MIPTPSSTDETTLPPGPLRRRLAVAWPILFGLIAFVILIPLKSRLDFMVSQVSQLIGYPYFQSSSEGLILSEAAIMRAGGSIYVPFRADSFISAPYPPLYYYLTAWVWSNDPMSLWTPGRLISLGAAIAAAFLIASLVFEVGQPAKGRWKLGLGLMVGLLAGITFLTLPAVIVWSARVRADMLMTALQLAGLTLVALGANRNQTWLIVGSILFFTLALYTKQTALAGPLAAGLYVTLWYGRRWRFWLAWWLGLVGAVGLPFLVLNGLSHNELFRRLFKYHNLPWQFENFSTYLSLFVQENAVLLILGICLLALTLVYGWQGWHSERQDSVLDRLIAVGRVVPLVVWFWLAGLASLVGLGVVGADHNHFLPIEAANCLVGGGLIVRLAQSKRGQWVGLLALVGLGLQLAVFSVPASRYEKEFRYRDAAYQTQMAKIAAFAASRPGPLLSSEAGWLVLTGKNDPAQAYYNDLFTLAALDKQGLYRADGLLERVRRKEFAVILTEGDLANQEGRPDVWTPALVDAIEQNYRLQYRDVWFSYVPK